MKLLKGPMDSKNTAGKSSNFRIGMSTNDDRLDKVVKIFECYSLQRILDIGCDQGKITQLLGKVTNASEVYGIDNNEESVKLTAQRGIKAFKLDIDRESLPFQNNSFDGIFCGELIEHLKDTDNLLDEIYRVLKPSGIAIITTPNLAAWYNRIALLLGFQPFLTDTGYRFYVGKMMWFGETGGEPLRVFTYKALKQTLVLHGFKIVKAKGTYPPIPRHHRLKVLYNILGKAMSIYPGLSAQLIFVVKKEEGK